ncbi:EF-hand_domain pair [Hexamita inflata]|uniref:EF-hand_domain pair n=1 Tax=Hexamita inflata TaxID=28002 RepID=A0ABP1GJP5_9EUKA
MGSQLVESLPANIQQLSKNYQIKKNFGNLILPEFQTARAIYDSLTQEQLLELLQKFPYITKNIKLHDIDFDFFKQLVYTIVNAGNKPTKARIHFLFFDKDFSGTMNYKELHSLLLKLGYDADINAVGELVMSIADSEVQGDGDQFDKRQLSVMMFEKVAQALEED